MNQPWEATISARYRRFAAVEAAGRSPLYEEFARGVAGDREALAFLSTLPQTRRQPNLLFAALRHLFGTPANWAEFRRTLLGNRDAVRAVMLARTTQTNEPARCATLLPVLARLRQPLALVEVGASAGLCLLPDFYAYDYGAYDYGNGELRGPGQLRPAAPEAEPPVFRCTCSVGTKLPTAMPEIVWRAGLDLNPLDAGDPDQAAWLETLVWPEQSERLANLRTALRIAAAVRPRVVRGDLLGPDLEHLCAEAPAHATLVVFHTAVLAYVATQADRDAFARRVMALCPYWIANEAPHLFPGATVPAADAASGRFLLRVNFRPVAWTDPHGAALEWIEE